jgi:hypothetical protein
MNRRRRLARCERPFHPAQVPEVTYWWDSAAQENVGSTLWRTPNRTLSSFFDMRQATLTAQPSVVTGADGCNQLEYVGTGGAPDLCSTLNPVVLGWTGATYWGGWIRFPDGQGTTGVNCFICHFGASGARGFNFQKLTTTVRIIISGDGITFTSNIWTPSWTDSLWHWIEMLYQPSLVANERAQYWHDEVKQTVGTPATPAASLFAANARLAPFDNGTTPNTDRTQLGPSYLCNGVPSSADRVLLRKYKAPRAL